MARPPVATLETLTRFPETTAEHEPVASPRRAAPLRAAPLWAAPLSATCGTLTQSLS
jgi:hypothetical protein